MCAGESCWSGVAAVSIGKHSALGTVTVWWARRVGSGGGGGGGRNGDGALV